MTPPNAGNLVEPGPATLPAGAARRERRGGETLFLPGGRAGGGRGARGPASRAGWTLPPHLQEQLPRRLRNIALLYALAYFFANFAPSNLTQEMSKQFDSPGSWIPGAASILIALVVAALASSPRVTWRVKMHLGLLFEVVGSYGIALSMYVGAERFVNAPIVFFALAPSWVAIWMLAYSIVVPAPPGRTLLALLASATAPGVIIANSLQKAGLSHIFTPSSFFLTYGLPNLIVVGLAYSCARIMVGLGADVSRARELGSYRLIERLGQGGMGEVWRASHQLLAREAAIKFIRPESMLGVSADASATMIRRFELEAKTTASLTSAHTIELYDFGVSDDGTFYYIMELLEGLDCDRLVRRFGALPPARAIHLLAQVCESLAEAHEKGLIHRDVKPANIYVGRSGVRCDFVKVLDFGLVAERRETKQDVMLTPPEHAIGTPAFMAPEIAQGQPIDGRSDLYGLGCVGYWLLTGRQVFEGSGFLEVISKHMHVEPEPPSRYSPGDLPRELDEVILRCLEKSPARRPDTAREVARLLATVPLMDSWRAEDAEAWWRENISGVVPTS
ncbi:MAG TPA: serine/threonine-protein kinase [Candidatus Eisenbacteria bacterium]|nr:serine/threonine-protein kinase [Candidatus Eisenbacteria bacterium]